MFELLLAQSSSSFSSSLDHSALIWNKQFFVCFCLILLFASFLTWNYFYLPSPYVCHAAPFESWVKDYSVLVCGASTGQTLLQYFRVFINTQGFTDGKLRHPRATRFVLLICSVQSLGVVFYHYDLVPYTCVDFLGVKTPPFLWFEWCCTVPFMFFLIAMLDVKRSSMTSVDWKVQVYGGGSILLLALSNAPFPRWLLWSNFTAANILMTYALILQQYDAYDEYCLSADEYNNTFTRSNGSTSISNSGSDGSVKAVNCNTSSTTTTTPPSVDKQHREIRDRFIVSQAKMNACMFISLFFSLFPLFYYMNYLQIINNELFLLLTLFSSYFSKVLFSQILFDSHVEILDPNKFLLIEEKKKAEESRLMFLRYVFHEVRVPLNSVSLGIQLLQENEDLIEEDRETLQMMRDATTFMTETLNDVLSLQKIEEGMLQLEYKPFAPDTLVKSVLNNFKTQYESKRIRMVFTLDLNVPKLVIGDQFRLEHVLGNLVSNAIKFSDANSQIEISVSYETKLKGHVTYTVKDYGPGMTSDEQKLLFQAFMQIRPGELQKGRGSGLGLSICKTIVTLHHGTIGCHSKKRVGNDVMSGGSEFYFNIEFSLPESASETSRNSHSSSSAVSSSSHRSVTKIYNDTSLPQITNSQDIDDADVIDAPLPADDTLPVVTESSNDVSNQRIAVSPSTMIKRKLYRDLVPDVATQVVLSRENSQNQIRVARSNSLRGGGSSGSSIGLDLTLEASPLIERSHRKEVVDIGVRSGIASSPRAMRSIHSIAATPSNTPSNAISTTAALPPLSEVPVLSTIVTPAPAADPTPAPPLSLASHLKAPAISVTTSAVVSEQKPATSSKEKKTNSTPECLNRILVVDDVLSNRKMLDMILKRKGFSNTEQCADGLEAVALVKEKGLDYYDLIFMDSSMPVMCGPEAATEIRNMGYRKLIIGVTGNAMDVDVQDYETRGADMILPKPLSVELLSRVFSYCEIHGNLSTWNLPSDSPRPAERLKDWVFPSK